MKYVMLRRVDGTLFALMGLGFSVTHAVLRSAWPGMALVGAGFVKFHENGEAETFGFSHSLRIGPDAGDARWITNLYRAGLPAPKFQPLVKSATVLDDLKAAERAAHPLITVEPAPIADTEQRTNSFGPGFPAPVRERPAGCGPY